jgi:hypothetical protein
MASLFGVNIGITNKNTDTRGLKIGTTGCSLSLIGRISSLIALIVCNFAIRIGKSEKRVGNLWGQVWLLEISRWMTETFTKNFSNIPNMIPVMLRMTENRKNRLHYLPTFQPILTIMTASFAASGPGQHSPRADLQR